MGSNPTPSAYSHKSGLLERIAKPPRDRIRVRLPPAESDCWVARRWHRNRCDLSSYRPAIMPIPLPPLHPHETGSDHAAACGGIDHGGVGQQTDGDDYGNGNAKHKKDR